MNARKIWSFLFVVMLLVGLVPTAVVGAAGPDWSKVDPALLDRLDREGTAEFHVVMAVQADVSGAAALKTKVEKTTYVYNLLRQTAEATQRPILSELAARGIPARSFYVYNAIAATGGLDTVQWLAARADVARIVSAPDARPDPVYKDMTPQERIEAVEWNVARVHAPDVWALGYRGEGLVVAGNDTGVQYDHPALVRQYRGCLNPPSCTSFDHNYNWWDGPGGYQYPHDYDGHGTHTMGTMVGEDASQTNQIGVAPGARWIACAGLGGSDPVDCFNFFLAPWDLNGQNADPNKAPDSINNSWYDPSGYDYRPIIQNLNAAGIAVIKSAGNQGPGCSTITNPGYVPEIIATAAFAQGDTIASFSSRGPSSNYGPTILKPEVAAPGVNIRSSVPGGGYEGGWQGTSMAAPHSTALVALMWNAAPCIRGDVPLTKQIMMETAEARIDAQCPPFIDHPNDVWGWGILDDLAAVQAAIAQCGGMGTLQGHVTEAYPLLAPGDPLPGITVTALKQGGGSWSDLTDSTGFYSLTLPAGTYTVTAVGPRYTGQTYSGIVVVTGTVTTLNFALQPQGLLYGYVTDADSGAPLAATITVAGDGSTTTDPATGYYEIYLDAGTYDVTAAAPDYISQTVPVNISAGGQTQQDFALVAMVAVVPEPIQITLTLGQAGTVEATLINHMGVAYPFHFYEIEGPRFPGILGSGGPDPFGYTYKDTNEPDGPRFDWIDATDGTPLNLGDDGEIGVSLPFPFTFYGTTSTNLCVGNNGGAIFNATTCDVPYNNGDLGSTTSNNLIAPFWDDIDSDTGNVYVKTVGTAPYRKFVVEWYNRPHYNNIGNATFELILYEGTNNIKYQYLDTDFGNPSYNYGASATCGIRQTTPNYLQYSYNQPVLVDGLAICFRYPGSPPCDPVDVPWYDTSIVSGSVPAGGSLDWTNSFTATPDVGITQPGEYHATLLVQPDVLGHPVKNVGVRMTVLPTASMGHLVGTVTSNRPGGPLEAQILIEASGGLSWTLSTDPATGHYGYWLDQGTYTVTASASGYVAETAVVQVTAQQTTTQDFELELLAPWAVVSPESLEQTLSMGQQATQTLTIANEGLLPLVWELREQGGRYSPLPKAEANTILLMGDDLTAADWNTYRTALAYAGVTWDEWDLLTQPFPTAAQLAPYETLIWTDENTLDPGDADCQVVADWLNSGGKTLFGLGRDFLWDLANGTPGAGEHNLYLLFNTTYLGDYAGTTIATLDGVPGDIIGDPFAPPNGLTLAGTLDSNGDYADENSVATTGLIYGPGGAGSGHAGLTHYESATYKTVWLGLNFHDGLTNQDQRNVLMENVLAFLVGLDVPWLSEEPISGTLVPGESVQVDVVFDAGQAEEPGIYTARLRVQNNDPLAGSLAIPVTMTVLPAANMGKLVGTVSGTGYCDQDLYPLAEAPVLIEGPGGLTWTVTTNPAGSYSRWLVEGTYTVTASAPDHVAATAVVTVTGQQTATLDFALRRIESCLDVTPLSYSLTLPVDTRFTDTLTLVNDGAGELVWKLYETTQTLVLSKEGDAPAAVYDPAYASEVVGVLGGPAPAPTGPLPTFVYPEDVLWDNGPLVTHPGGGYGGADASALQTALGMNTYGFGHQFSYGYRMADDFQITDPAGWQIESITFFAYQTNSPVNPSPITGVYYQIWDGPPNDPSSSVVFGNLTTNRLQSTTFSNIYRVLDTGLFDTARAIFANKASAGVTLPPGTYWLDWMTDGSASYTGPWAPPISILGQTTTGNALQYTGSWAPALDTGTSTPQGMPFIIEGSVPYGDVPWVSEVPTQGVVLADSVLEVEVIFDTSGLSAGQCYTASLVLIHDDPGWSRPLNLPLTLCVSQYAPPQASFTSNSPVCLGQPMVFTNTTIPGDPPETTYLWAFGDGEISTDTNPLHTYAEAGTYTVTLTAHNGVFSDTYTDTVEVLALPVAGFTYTIDQLTVVFTNTSQNATSYLWDLGDGITDTVANPVHTYAVEGTYTVTLWASGPCGTDEASAVLEIALCDEVNIVTVTQSAQGCVVTFAAVLEGDAPFTYRWDFGPFGTYTDASPVVDFQATGTYSGTLEVWNCVAGYDTMDLIVPVSCGQRYVIYLPLIMRGWAP